MSSSILPRGVGDRVGRRLTPEPERELPRDPVVWIRDELDEFTWSKQREVLRSVLKHRYTAVPAAHGPGKSFVAARLAAWWIAGHPPGEAFVVTTAPSGAQVRAILWREIRRAKRRGGLPGTITRSSTPEWTVDGELVAFGRKPQDLVDADAARAAFQGIHARYVLVVLDEAGGVPEWLWTAVDTLVTNEASRVLAIGNPDDPTAHFARVCAPGSGWHVIPISVFDTPNFTGERVPEDLRELLPSRMWVDERRKDWGEGSPLWTSKVLGLFPDVADDVCITPRMIEYGKAADLPGLERGRFGMDVARYGADESCVYRNRGGQIRLVDAWRGADTTESAERATRILDAVGGRLSRVPMSVDVVGLGAGVYDPLRHAGYTVEPFNGGEAANDPARFVNRRTEAWWAFREGLEAGLIDLDPDDLTLQAQLQMPRWKPDAAQKRIRLETKDEMKARGLPSPDRADAAVQSWYEGVTAVTDAATVLAMEEGEQSSITGDLLNRKT